METEPIFRDRGVLAAALVCLISLVGFLLWSLVTPLEVGVVASGQLVVSGERKEIAHLEGGIVRRLHVKEAARVSQGDPLITLEPIQSETARDEIANELYLAHANLARLASLRTAQDLQFSLDHYGLNPSAVASVKRQQTQLFEEQASNYQAERDVLLTRRASADMRLTDVDNQIRSTRRNLAVTRDIFKRRSAALIEQFETIENVQSSEREVLALESEISRLEAEKNLARRTMAETDTELAELETRTRRQVEEEASEFASEVLMLSERLQAHDDRLSRTLIVAPIDGVVLGLKANTVGGVVRPGEPIMEIVPETDLLVARLRLAPADREAVEEGQQVTALLSAYKQYRVPRISGEVVAVSADLKEDQTTGESFYEARVILDAATLAGVPEVELVPGLPVEAFIASGRTRTFADYVLEPIATTVRRGLSHD